MDSNGNGDYWNKVSPFGDNGNGAYAASPNIRQAYGLGGVMRRSPLFLGLAVLLWFAVSCDDPWTQARKHQDANAGMENTLGQLPGVRGFEKVNVLTFEAQEENDRGTTCYYATAYMILGSSISEVEAANLYSTTLLQSGWTLGGNQPGVLERGLNERVVVEYGPRSDGLEKIVEEAQSKGTYRSMITIRVEYILPVRNGC